MIHWAAAIAVPRWRPSGRLLAAIAFCFAIEAFKLTGLPLAWASWRISRLVFGTTPSLHNLLCSLAGATAAACLDVGFWALTELIYR